MSSSPTAGRTNSPSLLDTTNRHTSKPLFIRDTYGADDDSAINAHYSPDRLSSTVASILTSTPLVKTHLRTLPPPPREPSMPSRGSGVIGEEGDEDESFDSSPIPQTLRLKQHVYTIDTIKTDKDNTTTAALAASSTAQEGRQDEVDEGERILVINPINS